MSLGFGGISYFQILSIKTYYYRILDDSFGFIRSFYSDPSINYDYPPSLIWAWVGKHNCPLWESTPHHVYVWLFGFYRGSLSEKLLEPIEYFSSDPNFSHLFKDNCMVNFAEGLAEIQIYDINICIIAGFDGIKDPIVKVYQFHQTRSLVSKSMLEEFQYVIIFKIFYVFSRSFQILTICDVNNTAL